MIQDPTVFETANGQAELLSAKLHALRKRVAPEQNWLREDSLAYQVKVVSEE